MLLAILVLVYVSGCVEGNSKNVTWYAALNPVHPEKLLHQASVGQCS